MSFTLPDLPDDVESLRAIIAAQAVQLHSRDILIEKMRAQLAALRRARFGQSSEKVEREIAQLELALEEIEATDAATAPPLPAASRREEKAKPARQPFVHDDRAGVQAEPGQLQQRAQRHDQQHGDDRDRKAIGRIVHAEQFRRAVYRVRCKLHAAAEA